MSCTDNAKVSDSGYANTCDNSQSQRSESSSSRNSNGSPTGAVISVVIHRHLASSELGTIELMDVTDPGEHNGDSNINKPKEGLGCLNNSLDNINSNINNKEEFGAIVSLHDGLVIHSTASLETALGYSKDAWLGRSFIDYIHPKDKSTFADKLACNVILPFEEYDKDIDGRQANFFCGLRRYIDVEDNENINMNISNDTNAFYTEKLIGIDKNCNETAIYSTFHLNLKFKQYHESDSETKTQLLFLIITAQPVYSAYKASTETILSSIFSTRHNAAGYLSHVDDNVVQYFGYLPQEMLGCSLFNFYHPADLPFIKEIYETVVRLEGSSFKSKPYRFAVQNGGYVLLETEWSSFINPWEKKIEFVVGHHRVIRGPDNPDVFQYPDITKSELYENINEELLKESKIIQNEICALLAERIPTKSTSVDALNLAKQSSDLAIFVASLIHEVKGTARTKSPIMVADDRSFSEHDSVMLGEISPHHEYCESKSSSEVPPSYNQLNYNEKIERYFNSKLTTYDSGVENVNLTAPSNEDIAKTSSNDTPSNHNIPNHDSGRRGSDENLSNGSNNQTSSTSRDDSVNGNSNSIAPNDFKSMRLTETLLNKHNQDMEKLMVQMHKELRTSIKNSKLNKEARRKSSGQKEATNKQELTQCKMRGHKRSNNHTRENEIVKMAKYDEIVTKCDKVQIKNETIQNWDKTENSTVNKSVNPFPDNFRPSINNLTGNTTQCSKFPRVLLPIYYIPVPTIHKNTLNTGTSQQNSKQCSTLLPQVQSNSYVPYTTAPLTGVIYPPVIDTPIQSSMIYASPILKMSTVQNESIQQLNKIHPPPGATDRKRPASQATSIKAEPGSIMGMSESSKKLLPPSGHFSSCVSADGDCSSFVDLPLSIDNPTVMWENDSSLEDSSDSSFYGSFLNTSSGSSCNPDQILTKNISERYVSRTCQDEVAGHGRFSMVNELKAKFEIQTARQANYTAQKIIRKQDVGGPLSQDHMVRVVPPWLEGVNMTPEIIYQYQMSPKTLSEVLQTDMNTLKNLHQPRLVNDQLDQLYLDLELEGFGSKLILDDSNQSGDANISGDGGSSNTSPQYEHIRQQMRYSKMAMTYEENAPLPSF